MPAICCGRCDDCAFMNFGFVFSSAGGAGTCRWLGEFCMEFFSVLQKSHEVRVDVDVGTDVYR